MDPLSRIIEKGNSLVLVVLFGNHKGDITEIPSIKGKLNLLAEVSRYKLFHGEISRKCYIMVSQGSSIADPQKIIITAFGTEEKTTSQAVDIFLKETGIQESEIPQRELQMMLEIAKKMAAAGMLPEWMKKWIRRN